MSWLGWVAVMPRENLSFIWDAIELLDKMVIDGKAYTCFTSLVTAAVTPEEAVSAANLGDLTFVREAGFAEGCDVDSVSREFSCN